MTSHELLTRLARAKYLQETQHLSTADALTAVWHSPTPVTVEAAANDPLVLEPLEPLLDRLVVQYSLR